MFSKFNSRVYNVYCIHGKSYDPGLRRNELCRNAILQANYTIVPPFWAQQCPPGPAAVQGPDVPAGGPGRPIAAGLENGKFISRIKNKSVSKK